jgi:hypothetical protein
MWRRSAAGRTAIRPCGKHCVKRPTRLARSSMTLALPSAGAGTALCAKPRWLSARRRVRRGSGGAAAGRNARGPAGGRGRRGTASAAAGRAIGPTAARASSAAAAECERGPLNSKSKTRCGTPEMRTPHPLTSVLKTAAESKKCEFRPTNWMAERCRNVRAVAPKSSLGAKMNGKLTMKSAKNGHTGRKRAPVCRLHNLRKLLPCKAQPTEGRRGVADKC